MCKDELGSTRASQSRILAYSPLFARLPTHSLFGLHFRTSQNRRLGGFGIFFFGGGGGVVVHAPISHTALDTPEDDMKVG